MIGFKHLHSTGSWQSLNAVYKSEFILSENALHFALGGWTDVSF